MEIGGILGRSFSPENIVKGTGIKNFNTDNMLKNFNPEMLDNAKQGLTDNPYTSGEMNNKIQVPNSQNSSMIGTSKGSGFADTLKGFIGEVNNLQQESAQKSESFIRGEPIELHDVMIASNKATTSFQLLMELRNKGIDLYREISRLQ